MPVTNKISRHLVQVFYHPKVDRLFLVSTSYITAGARTILNGTNTKVALNLTTIIYSKQDGT